MVDLAYPDSEQARADAARDELLAILQANAGRIAEEAAAKPPARPQVVRL